MLPKNAVSTGEKKVKGRKRHIVTDILGNLLCVKVHAANIHDTVAGCDALDRALVWYNTIKGFCADAGYRGTFKGYCEALGLKIDISERIKPKWEILPKRWRVERSFAWLNGSRRLAKDFEISTCSEESQVHIAFSAVLLRRLFIP